VESTEQLLRGINPHHTLSTDTHYDTENHSRPLITQLISFIKRLNSYQDCFLHASQEEENYGWKFYVYTTWTSSG